MLVASFDILTEKLVFHGVAARKPISKIAGKWMIKIQIEGVAKNGTDYLDDREIHIEGRLHDAMKNIAEVVNGIFDGATDEDIADLASRGFQYDSGMAMDTIKRGGFQVFKL